MSRQPVTVGKPISRAVHAPTSGGPTCPPDHQWSVGRSAARSPQAAGDVEPHLGALDSACCIETRVPVQSPTQRFARPRAA
jgi:hypothetical protein